jgi:hypothetical protein
VNTQIACLERAVCCMMRVRLGIDLRNMLVRQPIFPKVPINAVMGRCSVCRYFIPTAFFVHQKNVQRYANNKPCRNVAKRKTTYVEMQIGWMDTGNRNYTESPFFPFSTRFCPLYWQIGGQNGRIFCSIYQSEKYAFNAVYMLK